MRSESPARPGDLVDGKYRIQTVLGVGGMGIVVRAFHEQLERQVAIKFLLTDLIEDAFVVQRFEREARATARLKSEHIIEVIDVGRLPSGEPFIVMEFLEGSDLLKVLAGGRQLPMEEVLDLAEQLCAGVAEAHAAGIVHRDIKPGNIYVTTRRDGRRLVKILDFGISKVADDPGGHALTQTTDLLGSPHYMSPEQLVKSRDAGPSCDVWALGVVLYRLLTGVLPFEGETLAEICLNVMQQQHVPVEHLRQDVPAWLALVVDNCLQKDVEDRMPSVMAMAAALRARAFVPADVTIGSLEQATTSFTPHGGVLAATVVQETGPYRVLGPGGGPAAATSRRGDRPLPLATTEEEAGVSRGTYVAGAVTGVVLVLVGAFAVHRFAPRPTPTDAPSVPSSPSSAPGQPGSDAPPDPRLPAVSSLTPPGASSFIIIAPPPATTTSRPTPPPKPHRHPPGGLPAQRK